VQAGRHNRPLPAQRRRRLRFRRLSNLCLIASDRDRPPRVESKTRGVAVDLLIASDAATAAPVNDCSSHSVHETNLHMQHLSLTVLRRPSLDTKGVFAEITFETVCFTDFCPYEITVFMLCSRYAIWSSTQSILYTIIYHYW